jgi:hypothetical protein
MIELQDPDNIFDVGWLKRKPAIKKRRFWVWVACIAAALFACLMCFVAGRRSRPLDQDAVIRSLPSTAGVWVFLGEFTNKEHAQRVCDQLKRSNLRGVIKEQKTRSGVVYAVVVSCYNQEYADGLAAYLKEHNTYGAVERHVSELPSAEL